MESLISKIYGKNKIPLQLNSHIRQHYITILKDLLTVEYTGKSRYCDPGSVQSNICVPVNCPLYYFEVEILKCDAQPKIVVGFTYSNYHLNKHPGTEPNSVGYKSEDGLRMNGTSKSENYGPSYGKGDIIGCGINYLKQNYFFTKNGILLGNAGQLFHIDHYPTIGLSNYGESVVFNFVGPFKFDIEDYFKKIFMTEREDINNQIVSSSVMDRIVKYYLLQRGYKNTLEAFNAEVNTDDNEEDNMKDKVGNEYFEEYYISNNVLKSMNITLDIRSEIFKSIINGDLLNAIHLVEKNYEKFSKSSLAYVMIITQHFIEMLRVEEDHFKALVWLKSQFSSHQDTYDAKTKNVIYVRFNTTKTCGILAYKDSDNPISREIFDLNRRLETAILVNDEILSLQNANISSLKTILQYLVLGRKLLKNVNGNTGPVYSAHDFCLPLTKLDK